MLAPLSIDEYLNSHAEIPLVDVRSPGEFRQGHIPGAVNIPLFTNEERAAVGTVYKQRSPEQAIALGYEFVNPKREHLYNQTAAVASQHGIAIHCWRGGLRSRLFAEHLIKYGMKKVFLISGGYKAYRRAVVDSFEGTYSLRTIGGYTGSGKTEILATLKLMGQQVVDLEKHAQHKGSAFGGLENGQQPSSEQFENELFMEWRNFDLRRPIWIEDESRTIGNVILPPGLNAKKRSQSVCFLQIPREERAKFLVDSYSHLSTDLVRMALEKITKKLGGQNAKLAWDYFQQGELNAATLIVLHYYDKFYEKGVNRRDPSLVFKLPLSCVDPEQNARVILNYFGNENKLHTTHPI